MFIRRNKNSRYNVRLSSSQVTPSNSSSAVDSNNESSYHRKTISSYLCEKIKWYCVTVAAGFMIAILIAIATIVPLALKSTSMTTKSTALGSSATIRLNVSFTAITLTSNTALVMSNPTTISQTTSAVMITTSTNTTASITTASITSISISTTTTTEISTITGASITTTTKSMTSTSITVTTSTTSTTMGPLRWNTTGSTVAGQLSMTNATSYNLDNPLGIFIDSSDTLYVADAYNNRVQQFLFGNTIGTTSAGQPNGVGGSTATRLNVPSDVAIDLNGNVYVVEVNNHRVQLWYVNATSGITVAGNTTAGNSTAQLNAPRGIALDSTTNTLYVSDSNNHRVMQYTLNSTVGTLIAGGNGAGMSGTQLNNPRGLYFESSTNSLLIANYGAHNIVRWVIGDSNWTLVAGDINGMSGSGPNRFSNPSDVVSDSMGNIYVADRFNHRIQFFQAGHINGTTIGGISTQYGNTSMKLNQPSSIALDSQLNLYVSDTVNNRVQQFPRY